MSDPIFIARFEGGHETCMNMFCQPDALDHKRGEQLARKAYTALYRAAGIPQGPPPPIVAARFEIDGKVVSCRHANLTHAKRRCQPTDTKPALNTNTNFNTHVHQRKGFQMKTSDAFPARFLQTATVKTKPIVATISHVDMMTVGQGADQKQKPVLHFADDVKPLIVNKTNWLSLADALGDDTEGWSGHKVRVYVARTQYGGKPTDGLRVQPVASKPSLKEALDDEVVA
jgi:hypothetical protein